MGWGFDPLHFGLVTVVALTIGLVTPPVGACLFVATSISNISPSEASCATLPFIIGLIAVFLLLVFFPELIL